MNNRL